MIFPNHSGKRLDNPPLGNAQMKANERRDIKNGVIRPELENTDTLLKGWQLKSSIKNFVRYKGGKGALPALQTDSAKSFISS